MDLSTIKKKIDSGVSQTVAGCIWVCVCECVCVHVLAYQDRHRVPERHVTHVPECVHVQQLPAWSVSRHVYMYMFHDYLWYNMCRYFMAQEMRNDVMENIQVGVANYHSVSVFIALRFYRNTWPLKHSFSWWKKPRPPRSCEVERVSM